MRTYRQVRFDLKTDARSAARTWIFDHVSRDEPIAFAQACWGNPIPESHTYKAIKFPGTDQTPCTDYYVMDEWLYQHAGPGKSPYEIRHYSEMIYLNPSQYSLLPARETHDKFLLNFDLIYTTGEEHYGPRISIFERKLSCQSNSS